MLFVLALAALMPSFAWDFDLSLGGILGLTAMVVGVLNTQHGFGIVPACLIGILVAVAAGCLNGFFVVTCDTNPLIVTLGMGTVFTGLIYFLAFSLSARPARPTRLPARPICSPPTRPSSSARRASSPDGSTLSALGSPSISSPPGVNGLQLLGAADHIQQLFYGRL